MKKNKRSPIILNVDDTDAGRYALTRILQNAGFAVWEASTGEETLAKVQQQPDLVLLDVNLPDMNGVEVCQKIKSNPKTAYIPVLHLSATFLSASDRAKALMSGADGYLVHPVDPNELIAQIKTLLRLRQVQDELRESEARFRRLAENADDLIYRYEFVPAPRFTYVNPAATKITGYTPEEHYADPQLGLKLVHPDDRHLLTAYFEGKGKFAELLTLRWIRKDGRIIWTEQKNVPIYDEQGKLIAMEGIARDITERKILEDKIVENERRLSQIVATVPNGITIVDQDGNITFANPAAEKILGLKIDEITRRSYSAPEWKITAIDGGPFPDEKLPFNQVKNSLQPVYNVEHAIESPSGQRICLSINAAPLLDDAHNFLGMVASFTDITELKEIEQSLRSLSDWQQTLLAAIPDIIAEVDNNHVYTWGNKAAYEFFGDDFIGKPAHYYFIGEQDTYQKVQPLLNGKDDVFYVESWQRRRDGTARLLAWWCRNLKDEHGKVVGALSTARDITERIQIEQTLREAVEKYEGLFNQSVEGIYLHDLEGKILEVNQMACKQSGFSHEELLQMSVFDFLVQGADSINLPKEEILRLWHEWKPGETHTYLAEHRHKDGFIYPVEISTGIVKYGESNIILAIVKDISERKKFEETLRLQEEQLRQAQKMEALGQLASGIAHDFNNILGIILGHISLLKMKELSPEKLNRSIEVIDKATRRGADLVKQLMILARKSEPVVSPVNLNEMVFDLTKMLRETFPKTIEIVSNIPYTLPFVLADASQIHQVLMNLCMNSRDAMPHGGVLHIEGEVVSGETVRKLQPDAEAVSYVALKFRDTGVGIPPEIKSRIFDPFFTTKEVGKGTGLGLSMVHSIVRNHGGVIQVDSQVGVGTTFTVYLPLPKEGNVVMPEKEDVFIQAIAGGEETILVIEDEEMLLDFVGTMLRAKGYKLLKATDGKQGVQEYQRNQEQIDLVITDLGLPQLTGEEVFRQIRRINPHAKVIIASGYIDPTLKSELYKQGVCELILKPYQPANLLRVIREVLDRK